MTDKRLSYRLNKQEVCVQTINEVYTLHVWHWYKEDVQTTSENKELKTVSNREMQGTDKGTLEQ